MTIPANTTALLVIPYGDGKATVMENNTLVWENEGYKTDVQGVVEIERSADQLTLSLLSGRCNFKVVY